MAISIHPKSGQILMCDFSNGFKKPEMIKKRPIVVLAEAIQGRNNLVTVVPLSTVEPVPIQPYHYKILKSSMPMVKNLQLSDSWVKGDMIYTVGFHRLDLIPCGEKDASGKRKYFKQRLGPDQMKLIYSCVLHGLNLGHLQAHL